MMETSACEGRIGHDREGDVTDDEVERVHLGRDGTVATLREDGRKDDCHDDHHEQGVQHAPDDTKDASAVLALEVTADELL